MLFQYSTSFSFLLIALSNLWFCESQSTDAPTPVYAVHNGTEVCLLVQMDLKFKFYYISQDDKKVESDLYLTGNTKDNVTVSGSCAMDLQVLHLEWTPSGAVDPWSLGMQFRLLPSGKFSMDLLQLNFTTSGKQFPSAKQIKPYFMMQNTSQFTCPTGSYYQCVAKQTSKLFSAQSVRDADSQLDVFVTLSQLKAQAFRSGSSETFSGTPSQCSADFVPNTVVPIVIGVALAAMIIIALATFIIGSRRRQQGYREI